MTNEELACKIQTGETELMSVLWEQTEKFATKQAVKFYYKYSIRCSCVGLEIQDLIQESYIGIQRAVEKYDFSREVKFLTCARYYLWNQFYQAAKMHRAAGYKMIIPISLNAIVYADNTDTAINRYDITASAKAQAEINNVIEQNYLAQFKTVLMEAIEQLPTAEQKNTIFALGEGLGYAEYAQQRGVNRNSTRHSAIRALNRLRANEKIAAFNI